MVGKLGDLVSWVYKLCITTEYVLCLSPDFNTVNLVLLMYSESQEHNSMYTLILVCPPLLIGLTVNFLTLACYCFLLLFCKYYLAHYCVTLSSLTFVFMFMYLICFISHKLFHPQGLMFVAQL